MNRNIKILPIIVIISFAFSCSKKLDQNNMFQGRTTKNKKQGHYDTGVRRNKPMSVQLTEDMRKESGNAATDPKKAARKEEKELKKKQALAQKARSKHNKKVHQKVETTKGKSTGGGN